MQSLYLSRDKRHFVAVPFIEMRFSIVFLCIIVHLAIVLPRTLALLPWFNSTEPSICTKLIKTTKTLFVSYLESYLVSYENRIKYLLAERGNRVNYRVEDQRFYNVQEICCEGYEVKLGRCVPICTPECENGFCAAPNLCECFQGYTNISTRICIPVCSKGCLHGICVKPEQCECPPNYLLNVDTYICRPLCDEKCYSSHGYCSLPTTCVCLDGYELSNEPNICKPICQIECVNGICIKPDVCSCSDGYELYFTDSYICKPKCDEFCAFGTCTAPNICSCDQGYELSDHWSVCKPICNQECVMGTCTAPEICTCLDGYASSKSSMHICEPICEHACVNGTCIAPNTCKCNDEFVVEDGNVTLISCKPFCTSPCEDNAECTAPERCTCKEGYRVADKNDTMGNFGMVLDSKNTTCIPICENDCINGKCVSPNVCICNEGYQHDEKGLCMAFCFPSCINGTCIEPNVCSCEKGFILRNETICESICENVCANGTCISPNTCQCNENFLKMKTNNASTCVPACSRNCSGRGTCLNELNTCFCFFGWTGWDCNEASVCVFKTTLDSPLLSSVTVINETNSTLMESYDNAPLCYHCSDSLNNETLCLAIQSDESLTIPNVGCFLSTGLHCYERLHYNAFNKSTHVTISLISVAITIIAITAVAGYAIVHKRRKQKTAPVHIQSIQLDEPETEVLIGT